MRFPRLYFSLENLQDGGCETEIDIVLVGKIQKVCEGSTSDSIKNLAQAGGHRSD